MAKAFLNELTVKEETTSPRRLFHTGTTLFKKKLCLTVTDWEKSLLSLALKYSVWSLSALPLTPAAGPICSIRSGDFTNAIFYLIWNSKLKSTFDILKCFNPDRNKNKHLFQCLFLIQTNIWIFLNWSFYLILKIIGNLENVWYFKAR